MMAVLDHWEPSSENRALVYIAVNSVTGACYVGYTTKSLRERRRKHFVQAARKRRQDRFGHAIRKYGPDSFHFMAVGEYPSQAAALEAERAFIDLLRPRYNSSAGGLGCAGFRHSDESKAKMRAWHQAHPEHKPRLGVLAPGAGKRGHQTKIARGTVSHHSAPKSLEARSRISATKVAAKRKSTPAQLENLAKGCLASKSSVSRPVICLNDGSAFASAAAAALAYGLDRQAVCRVANPLRPQKSVKGLRFEYVAGDP